MQRSQQCRFFTGLVGWQGNEAQRKRGGLRRGRYQSSRAVGRVVVGNEDFEMRVWQGLSGQVAQELGQSGCFIAGSDEDGECGRGGAGRNLTP